MLRSSLAQMSRLSRCTANGWQSLRNSLRAGRYMCLNLTNEAVNNFGCFGDLVAMTIEALGPEDFEVAR